MSDKKVHEVVEVNPSLESVQGFWEKNKNVILGIAAAIVLNRRMVVV